MSDEQHESEALRELLRESYAWLEWAIAWTEGRPGTAEAIAEMNRLMGKIEYALDFGPPPAPTGDEDQSSSG